VTGAGKRLGERWRCGCGRGRDVAVHYHDSGRPREVVGKIEEMGRGRLRFARICGVLMEFANYFWRREMSWGGWICW